MTIFDDETLQAYIEESVEHLSDIENDLLAIESAGENLNEDLVNKVFRAAHSVKGGAGFMGLTNIKELAHRIENILGMIRSREITPSTEIISILLSGSDALKGLINNVEKSNKIDVSQHIEALSAFVEKSLADDKKEAVLKNVQLSFPDGSKAFDVAEYDILEAQKSGKNIYLVSYDLIHDVHQKSKTPMGVLAEMQEVGTILESKIDLNSVGTLEDNELSNRIPFLILFSSILKPQDINMLFEIDENNIFEISKDLTATPIAKDSPKKSAEKNDVEITQEIEPQEILDPDEEETISENSIEEYNRRVDAPTPEGLSDSINNLDENNVVSTSPVETSIRVNVRLLDSLMNLAGELVLGRNQLLQSFNSGDHRASKIASQRIDLITSELQEAIMLTRMQPVGIVFNKFPRVVRDLAGSLGKKVELAVEGRDVELDKTIIEAISDPITHLVRNSVDHGIESPEERQKLGKELVGKIYLRAYHEAGQVNIEVIDDGKGLDGNKLANTAVSNGLINEDQAALMSEKEKINLVFLPGFSTANEITDVSGRGVGMDVVKTNLDKLGGQVDIESKPGSGSTIRIKLPLTLAIIPSQIVRLEGERYAIPQVNLEELLRIPADQVRKRIERVGDAEVVRLRGKLLPLLSLSQILGIQSTYFDPETGEQKPERRKKFADERFHANSHLDGTDLNSTSPPNDINNNSIEISTHDEYVNGESDQKRQYIVDRRFHAASALNIAVVSTGPIKYGLVVDELNDSEEIVVKPLGRHLNECKAYVGATLMGDGRIALILDVGNLSRIAQLASLSQANTSTEVLSQTQTQGRAKMADDIQSFLLFRSNKDEWFAVPLNLVERIEKIKRSTIENVGGKNVIQYRGGSLPLFTIDQVAQVKPLSEEEDLLVIVFVAAEREAGLLCVGPIDAIDISLNIDDKTLKQPGIIGSANIKDHTTLLVDMLEITRILNPNWFNEISSKNIKDGFRKTVLYAEDSSFFRNQVKGFLEDDGYAVIEAEDGLSAWQVLQDKHREISLVLTDLEMPKIDGFELTKMIKSNNKFSHLPVIALTTLASDIEIKRGKESGIDSYQIKLDRDKLLKNIKSCLNK